MLAQYGREPFQQVLADWLLAAPDVETIAEAAARSPDRWAQGLSILARLSGYHDKQEVDLTVSQRVEVLSDAELLAELRRLRAMQELGEYPYALEGEDS